MLRTQEEAREQMAKIIEMMVAMFRGKGVANIQEEPPYPPRYTNPHATISQEAYIPLMPLVGIFPYMYVPSPAGHHLSKNHILRQDLWT